MYLSFIKETQIVHTGLPLLLCEKRLEIWKRTGKTGDTRSEYARESERKKTRKHTHATFNREESTRIYFHECCVFVSAEKSNQVPKHSTPKNWLSNENLRCRRFPLFFMCFSPALVLCVSQPLSLRHKISAHFPVSKGSIHSAALLLAISPPPEPADDWNTTDTTLPLCFTQINNTTVSLSFLPNECLPTSIRLFAQFVLFSFYFASSSCQRFHFSCHFVDVVVVVFFLFHFRRSLFSCLYGRNWSSGSPMRSALSWHNTDVERGSDRERERNTKKRTCEMVSNGTKCGCLLNFHDKWNEWAKLIWILHDMQPDKHFRFMQNCFDEGKTRIFMPFAFWSSNLGLAQGRVRYSIREFVFLQLKMTEQGTLLSIFSCISFSISTV